ncbi:MAG TPA: RNA methyltransferase [Thermomicrobiales bacterium]|nr:RNA methyltransferase [Thermomicrobiales bacterium]
MSDRGAADRRELARQTQAKASRWPRTERRVERVTAVLARRQVDLTVVLENVHDPHNVSAVLRSCDATGVLRAHAVYTDEEPPPGAFARTTSASAAKWVEVVRHESITACYASLRAAGFAIYATALTATSDDLYDVDLTRSVALVFGNEMRGVSDEASERADRSLAIPMMGMVQSLNISVACAVSLYEALRQRRAADAYDRPSLDPTELASLRDEWLRR